MVEPVPIVERQVVLRIHVPVVVVVRVPQVNPPIPVEVRWYHVQVGDLQVTAHLPALVADVVVAVAVVDAEPAIGVLAPASYCAVIYDRTGVVVAGGN